MSVVQWAAHTHRGLKRYTAVVDGTKYVLFQNDDGTYNVNRFDNDGGPGKLVGKSYMYGLAEAKRVALGQVPKRNPEQYAWVTQYMDQLPRHNDVRDAMKPIYHHVVNSHMTSITPAMLRNVVRAAERIRAETRAHGFMDNQTTAAWPVIEQVELAAGRELKRQDNWRHGAKSNPKRSVKRPQAKRNPMDKPTYDAGLKRAKQIGIDNAETALDQRKAYPSVRAAYAAFIVNAIDTVNEQRLPGREVAVQAFLDHVAKPKRKK